jgi:hypothetical protein
VCMRERAHTHTHTHTHTAYISHAPVAHACNPSYSEGRDQKDQSSKSARHIVHETLSRKNPSHTKQKGLVDIALESRVPKN